MNRVSHFKLTLFKSVFLVISSGLYICKRAQFNDITIRNLSQHSIYSAVIIKLTQANQVKLDGDTNLEYRRENKVKQEAIEILLDLIKYR